MPQPEKKLIEFIKAHLDIVLLLIAAAAGLLIRIPLKSAYAIPAGSGGNVVHIVGDIVLAAAVMIFIRILTGNKNKAAAIAALMLVLPSVFVSSVMCGRWENFSFALCMFAFSYIEKKYALKGMILYAAACGISPYALLLLPYVIKAYGKDEKFLRPYCLMPVVTGVTCACLENSYLPAGLINKHLYEDCGSFFAFLNGNSEKSFTYYLPICIVLFIFALYMLMRYFDRMFETKSAGGKLVSALIITETMAMLLPGADAGSTAFGAMLALCAAFTDIRFIPVAVVLGYLRLIPMTGAIYGADWMTFSLQGQAWIRTAVLIAAYVLVYLKRDKKHVL